MVVSLPWVSVQAQTAKSEGYRGNMAGVSAAVTVGKPLPNFPLRYRGAGRFRHAEIPSFQLVARYTFDMEAGVNREVATFIDREVEIFNVYDMDPSDGVDPDREYFIERDQQTGELHCTLNEPPLPNVFSRDWWLSNNMVYVGTEMVSGFEADCWTGAVPGIGLPVKLCSRADKYPELSLLLKKLGPFEFYDHYGVSLEGENAPPPAYFNPRYSPSGLRERNWRRIGECGRAAGAKRLRGR
jgi:hypothetical protein